MQLDVTLDFKRIVRLSGDVTDRSKAAGLPKTQLGTKRSAGHVWLRLEVTLLPISTWTPR